MRTTTLTPRAASVTAALAAALAIGCADDGAPPSGPDGASAAAAATAGTPRGVQSADTTRPTTFPATVRVRGRVLTTVWTPGRTVADTLSGFEPVAGARVTLYRNVLVDGRGVSERIGERVTGADGAFTFEGVPGGPYVLALNATAARPYGETLTYVLGNAAEVSATLRVWTTASAPVDSTGGS